jgi:hypothetical protein
VTHTEVRDRLGDYLEGDLSLAQRALLDAHIDGCSDCAAQLESLRNTVRLLRNLSEVDVPVSVADAVLQRLDAGEGQPTWWIRLRDGLEAHSRPRHLATVALAAVALTIVAILRPGLLPLGFPARGMSPAPVVILGTQAAGGVSALDIAHQFVPGAPGSVLIGTAKAEDSAGEPLRIPPFESRSLVVGMSEPRVLLEILSHVPIGERAMWLERHTAMAARLGIARNLADRLRGVPDAQAADLATQFERADYTAGKTR